MIFRKIKIISGGQSGVDRAALDFALKNGIRCGGWCPLGRLAEDGIIPDTYPLKETITADYEERTKLNVRDSDGTIIIYKSVMDKGTALTIDLASLMKKPIIIFRISDDLINVKNSLKNWITKNNISVINIAGLRESSSPGIYNETLNFLDRM